MSLSLFVDGHVHVHPRFDVGRFFSAGQRNLQAAAKDGGCADGQWRGALMLVEAGSQRVFEQLARGELAPPKGIRIEKTADPAALRVHVGAAAPLYLIAGRQIATTSGVEVLSLATCEVVPDGLTFGEALARACKTDGLAAIPWGFGKWSMARGELVKKELLERAPGSIALGDNGGRLGLAPVPPLFKFAAERGFAVLPGSDPFPFPGEVERVGSYGFVLSDWQDNDRPARTLLQQLRGMKASPRYFGHLTGMIPFAVAQVRMQIHNRFLAPRMAS